MPIIPLITRLILVHKFSCNLQSTELIPVSMVIVNNRFLATQGHEYQDRKCRDPKSNAVINGFYTCVLLWPYRGIFHSQKYIQNAVCYAQQCV